MRLGVDFGTTRIVVAAVDQGNYPLVSFDGPDGERCDWYPPLVAVRDDRRVYGWDAWAAQQESGWTIVRSLKRYLEDAGPKTKVMIGGQTVAMLDLLTELLSAFRTALAEQSSLHASERELLEIVLGVPANANGNQRFLTVEAFRRAGFAVLGLLNEPSAASVEFSHSNLNKRSLRAKSAILVYDLGGGTFDASLVETDVRSHSVTASEGIPALGGDDFDTILAELAMDRAGVSLQDRDALGQGEWFRLHEECRQRKEALHPNTRRITIELEAIRPDWPAVSVPTGDFYERCQPLIDETIHAVQDLLETHKADVEALYVTGGGSELPLVSRILREKFGRRVRRSSYAHSATAIGLAIQADAQAAYVLRERFTRNFGVWREAEGGRSVVFDPLFQKGTKLPGRDDPPLEVCRRYRPAHNIGHFRYLECSHRQDDGRPNGDITFWDEIVFPFDPSLKNRQDVSGLDVGYWAPASQQEVEEIYCCDAGGAVAVTIRNASAGYQRHYRLGRWAVMDDLLVPGKRKLPASRKAT